MKSIFTLVSVLWSWLAFGQSTQNEHNLVSKIAALYNAGAYTELYAQYEVSLKTKMTEAQNAAFYKNNLHTPLGNILTWQPIDTSGSLMVYAVKFEKGMLNLSFSCNAQNEITTIRWQPAKPQSLLPKRNVTDIKSNNPKLTAIQRKIDSLALSHLENSANCGLSIGVIHDGVTEQFFYGSVNKNSSDLPNPETMYEIGSVTKTFTSLLLAHTINKGKLKGDADIRKYLPGTYPDLEYKGQPITLLNLANHTSGLPRIPANLMMQPGFDLNDPYKNYTEEMIWEYLRTFKLDTLPGTVESYSNLGVAVLGLILEKVYHKPLEELMHEYITALFKMPNTRYAIATAEAKNIAKGYDSKSGKEAPSWTMNAFQGCGGLHSNLADMMQYLSANMQEKNADIALTHKATYTYSSPQVGISWMLSTAQGGHNIIWHNGATAGYTSFCGFIKETSVGIVVLNNSGNNVDELAMEILRYADNKN